MQLTHLNYMRSRNEHLFSMIRVEAHNRTIFMKKFSFAQLAAARRDVSSQGGLK